MITALIANAGSRADNIDLNIIFVIRVQTGVHSISRALATHDDAQFTKTLT
jgi:hypothetical protein